jgi:hypothetical protein
MNALEFDPIRPVYESLNLSLRDTTVTVNVTRDGPGHAKKATGSQVKSEYSQLSFSKAQDPKEKKIEKREGRGREREKRR